MAVQDPMYRLPQPNNDLQGPIKGHVSLKSSPFSSTCTRLSSQHLVQDRMNVHYEKLNKAKSSIDSSPPKSIETSIKKRDQLRRDAIIKASKASPSSRPSSRATTRSDRSGRQGSPSRQALELSFTSAELNHLAADDRLSPSPYSRRGDTARLLRQSTTPQEDAHRPTSRLTDTSRTMRFPETDSPRLNDSTKLRSARLDQTRPPSGDLLDKMAGKFTAPGRLHTPRTLNTTATSRLAQSKNYNKPKKHGAQIGQNGNVPHDNAYEEVLQDYENDFNELDGKDDAGYTERRSADHVKWVEDQARRVQSLRLDELIGEDENDGEGGGFDVTRSNQRPFYSTGNLSTRSYPKMSKRMKDEEDELRYLEFVTDVTNDVLHRGIYTNSVLKQVFDSHIERNKDRLDKGRMQHLMAQLQEDLFIPNSDNEEDERGDRSAIIEPSS